MADRLSYRCRRSPRGGEQEFLLTQDRLQILDGSSLREIPFAEIRKVRIHHVEATRHNLAHWRCIVSPSRVPAATISGLHFGAASKLQENRSAPMQAFTSEFLLRAARANPAIVFMSGIPLAMCVFWLVAFCVLLGFIGFGAYIFVAAFIGTQAVISGMLGVVAGAALVTVTATSLLGWIRKNWPARFDPLDGDPANS